MQIRKLFLIGGFVLGAAYILHGFAKLTFSDTGASDLFRRSFEVRQILRGQSPYDVYAGHYPEIARQITSETGHEVPPLPERPEFEPANVPAYPPWSFPLLVATAGVPWPLGRFYFAALDALALGALFLGLRKFLRGDSQSRPREGEALVAAMLVSSIGGTLGLGQYGVLVLGLAAAAFFVDETEGRWRPELAGFLLALSMLKFNITLPFVFVFAVRKRWRVLAAGLVTGAALMALGCWSIRTGPVAAMRELRILLSHNLGGGDSLPQMLATWIGYSDRLVSLTTAAVLVAGGATLYLLRRQSSLVLCAIAAFIARVSIYHRHYDDLVLVYLLLALWQLAPRSRFAKAAFWLMALSLWFPPRVVQLLIDRLGSDALPVAAQYLAWTIGAIAVTYAALTSDDRPGVRA